VVKLNKNGGYVKVFKYLVLPALAIASYLSIVAAIVLFGITKTLELSVMANSLAVIFGLFGFFAQIIIIVALTYYLFEYLIATYSTVEVSHTDSSTNQVSPNNSHPSNSKE
jgi:hypothetical protein